MLNIQHLTKAYGDKKAVDDLSLHIAPGEICGFIGHNGAGKSTLLKLLSRVTAPTKGTISYNGRIASMLEVGTGFHPELTGRENVYMNGAILGMTKAEIRQRSAFYGLPTAGKPALACLATRIPYGTKLEEAVLRRIDLAETALFAMGLTQVRVRAHGNVARIEVPKEDILAVAQRAQEVAEAVKACGFDFAALDLSGYRMGSLNIHLDEKK